jgi:hypothetical protein
MTRRRESKFCLTELVGLESTSAPRAIELGAEEQVIGRSERADVRIPIPSISRRHAAVWLADGVPHVKDLGSQSGTFVNSAPVSGPTPLRQGDLVSLGTTLVFLVSREEGAAAPAVPEQPTTPPQMVDSPLVELALSAVSPEKARRYLEALYAVADQASATRGESQLLAFVLDQLESVIKAERFFAMLGHDPANLAIVARKLAHPDLTKKWSMPSKEILRQALGADKPVISFDAQSDERFRRRTSIAMSDVHSAICISLRVDGAPLGVLYADNHVAAGLFSIEDGHFLAAIGRVVALSLQRARAAQQVKQLAADGEATVRRELLDAVVAEADSHLERMDELCQLDSDEHPLQQIAGECRRLRRELDRLLGPRRERTAPGLGDA